MLDIRSKTWDADKDAAVGQFMAGTISPEDETVLRQSTCTSEWLKLCKRRRIEENSPLITEAKQSSDLNTRLLMLIIELLGGK